MYECKNVCLHENNMFSHTCGILRHNDYGYNSELSKLSIVVHLWNYVLCLVLCIRLLWIDSLNDW